MIEGLWRGTRRTLKTSTIEIQPRPWSDSCSSPGVWKKQSLGVFYVLSGQRIAVCAEMSVHLNHIRNS